LQVPFGTPGDLRKTQHLEDPKGRTLTDRKPAVKLTVMPDKMVNIVVRGRVGLPAEEAVPL